MATQPQQQSSSEEGSKENTILNGPRHNRDRSAQDCPSGSTDNRPQGPAPTAPTTQAGGPPQAPPVTNPNGNHQDPPEHNEPMDPPEHLQMAKAQELLNQRTSP